MATQRGLGMGSFLLGMRRQCSENSALEASAVIGPNPSLSLHAWRQLSAHSTGAVQYNFDPDATGLTVTATRQVVIVTNPLASLSTTGEFNSPHNYSRTMGRKYCLRRIQDASHPPGGSQALVKASLPLENSTLPPLICGQRDATGGAVDRAGGVFGWAGQWGGGGGAPPGPGHQC
eukprot:8202295-Pyramimonas_sp.AAC.1